jgi:hypothetical protein
MAAEINKSSHFQQRDKTPAWKTAIAEGKL